MKRLCCCWAPTLLLLSVLVVSLSKAERVVPRWCNKDGVRHVHLSVGQDPATQMIVSFASIPSYYSQAPVGAVEVGTSAGRLKAVFVQSETATSYRIPCRKGTGNHHKKRDVYYSHYYHHVTISGLEPETTYYYHPFAVRENNETAILTSKLRSSNKHNEGFNQRLLLEEYLPAYDGSNKDCSSPDKIRSFRTAPASGKNNVRPTSMAILGDLGQYRHSEATMMSLLRSSNDIDAVILSGDLAYSRMDHRQWDTFFDFLEDYPIAEMKPLQIVPGNHDIDKTRYSRDIFLAYENRFRMPRVKPPALGQYTGPSDTLDMDKPPYPLDYEWGNAYYVYSYGPVRMLMLSAYSSMEPGSTQYQWIVKELSAVDRETTPWLCVVIHTPLYNTFGHHRHDLQIVAARQHLDPLFVQYTVNVVFSGHIHAYSRSTGIQDGRVDSTGPVHIVVGAGGRKCEAPFRAAEPEPWVAVRDATFFGYGVFRVLNATHAGWSWVHTGQQSRWNQLYRTNITLPAGPSRDRVVLRNQYFLNLKRS